MENVDFFGFLGNQPCGARHTIFGLNEYNSDKIPNVMCKKCDFTDTSDEGFVFFTDPNPELAVAGGCGNFPCTGKDNFAYVFEKAKF